MITLLSTNQGAGSSLHSSSKQSAPFPLISRLHHMGRKLRPGHTAPIRTRLELLGFRFLPPRA